ncbi:MAG: hypothetical protein VXY90_13730, partial [Pseudomonadota bacterium]|nr:hypothetical protein [Pseudomonadota bacterium]MEC8585824.1 hypothetical protein [Pseudomonadota bacterium]
GALRMAWALRREVAASVHEERHLRCVTPALPERVAQVTVELSLNGQQYTTNDHVFLTHGRPAVASLSPSRGPVTGGTLVRVSGGALDGRAVGAYRCRFGEAEVGAAYDAAWWRATGDGGAAPTTSAAIRRPESGEGSSGESTLGAGGDGAGGAGRGRGGARAARAARRRGRSAPPEPSPPEPPPRAARPTRRGEGPRTQKRVEL